MSLRRYLTTVGGKEGVGELESKILDTNPIMVGSNP